MRVINQAPEPVDFIIVGGGTAGCAVAGRLAETPKVTVLVIEAGISNPGDVGAITTPARAFELRGGKHDWAYKTGMIDRAEYMRVEKPNTRGKVLGGSSCLNYYTWIPGSRGTYDDWEEEFLYKPTTYHDDGNVYRTDLKYIGSGGPLPVSHSDLLPETKEFRDALQTAWVSSGEELTDDVHSGTMTGLWPATNSIYNGKRSSSWMYLEGKPNVMVMAGTRAKQLLFEKNDNDTKATEVEVVGPDGQVLTMTAKDEVIVSLGVFESPKLLMLSGIWPKETLDKFGIDAICKNKSPYTSVLLELVGLPRIDDRLSKHPAYLAAKEANGGKDPFGPAGQPHFEIDFVPMFSDAFQWHFPTPPQGDYLTVIVDLLRPTSRSGVVTLKSTDPLEQADIRINFFSNELDLIFLAEGVRFVYDVLTKGEGMRDLIVGWYPWAMPLTSDEAMIRQILERSQTGFHPCGTARMSKDIGQGVDKLRVIDTSVIPIIPDCRIQNSVYMIAEKGADMIKAAYLELY